MRDLISRQAAIDALHTWFRDGFDEDKWWNSTHVLAAIKGLPPAQPIEDIHREKEQAYYCGYEDGAKAVQWDWLKTEIKRMKRSFTTCINSDYYTGYMSALSAVEGYIAKWEGDAK